MVGQSELGEIFNNLDEGYKYSVIRRSTSENTGCECGNKQIS